ncbi:MAG: DUF5106 domain-containing protein [Muribaculaceae bacterium]|nr:DUF5106 domain-containing protein [Muribaculaceae bacterium]
MMKKIGFIALFALVNLMASAQFYGVDTDKLTGLVMQLSNFPQDNAVMILQSTLNSLAEQPKSYRKAVEMIERMGDPADSLHNEVLYAAGLSHVVSSYVLSGSEKARPQAMLAVAKKNAIGGAATDVQLTLADGKTTQLLAGNGKPTLVYFNDPSCEACHQVKANLEASKLVKDMAEGGELNVVAVYPGKEQKQWKRNTFEPWIVNGYDKAQAIEENDAYALPTMPLFYLLAADGTVLIKNEPSLSRIENALNMLKLNPDKDNATLVKLLFNVH